MMMRGCEVCLPIAAKCVFQLITEATKEDEKIDPEMKSDYAYELRERMRMAHHRARGI